MEDWERGVKTELADYWGDELTEEYEQLDMGFNEAQWMKAGPLVKRGFLFLSSYDEKTKSHDGAVHLAVNMNDHFMYASSWSTSIPSQMLDEVLSIPEGQYLTLEVIAARIEGVPPVNEIVDEMEKCGYISKEITDNFRRQHKENGTENERW
ncbi:MAG: hypothetical protein V3W52_17145 [Syntrophobacteria bacterium]